MAQSDDFLETIRRDPEPLLGQRSLNRLYHFDTGFGLAAWANDAIAGQCVPYGFHEWVRYRLHLSAGAIGWQTSLLERVGSEEAAFDLFFVLLDDFKRRQRTVFASFSDQDPYFLSGDGQEQGRTITFVTYTDDPGFFIESNQGLQWRFFSGFDDFEFGYHIWRWQLEVCNEAIFDRLAAESAVDDYFRPTCESMLVGEAQAIALVEIGNIRGFETGAEWSNRQVAAASARRVVKGSVPETFELRNEAHSWLSSGLHLAFLNLAEPGEYVLSSALSLRKVHDGKILWTDGAWWELGDLISRITSGDPLAIGKSSDSDFDESEDREEAGDGGETPPWDPTEREKMLESGRAALEEINKLPQLARMRLKPGMYMGTKSIVALYFNLQGYRYAVDRFQLKDVHGLVLPSGFPAWLASRLDQTESKANWMDMILKIEADEEKAFDRFFEFLDEYTAAHAEA